jgi:hypothetical protein
MHHALRTEETEVTTDPAHAERCMEISNPDIYRTRQR